MTITTNCVKWGANHIMLQFSKQHHGDSQVQSNSWVACWSIFCCMTWVLFLLDDMNVGNKHAVWQSQAHLMPRWQRDWTLRADRAMPIADLFRREAVATNPTHLRRMPLGPTMTTTVAAAITTGTATSTAPPSSPSPTLVRPYPPCPPLSSLLLSTQILIA